MTGIWNSRLVWIAVASFAAIALRTSTLSAQTSRNDRPAERADVILMRERLLR
jgi:hypothetical protein